jgi:hypothetical protein
MLPRKLPIVTDEISGKKRIRSYDVRIASQQFANIAGILAGFAFTIVILVAQENKPDLSEIEILRRNLAAISFFVSFFGCILASFTFALISGEEALTQRANHMAFFAGGSFSLTMGLLFWSIAAILKAFLVEKVALFAYQIFPLFIIIHPIFVASSILDNIYIFDCRKPRLSEYLISFIPSVIPILLASLLRISGFTVSVVLNESIFYLTIWLFLILIIIGNSVSAIFSTANDDLRINIIFSSIWMCIYSVVISVLIVLI